MTDNTESFADIESLLARHPPDAAPLPLLRARIIQASQSRVLQNRWETLAACLLLGVTLFTIFYSIQHTAPTTAPSGGIAQLAAKIQSMDPSLPPEQTERLAVLLATASRLKPAPDIHGHPVFSLQMGDMP